MSSSGSVLLRTVAHLSFFKFCVVSFPHFLRYVNCAHNDEENNLVVLQYRGEIFYRCCRPIKPRQELLVWYEEKYAKDLGVTFNCIWKKKCSVSGNFKIFLKHLCLEGLYFKSAFSPVYQRECEAKSIHLVHLILQICKIWYGWMMLFNLSPTSYCWPAWVTIGIAEGLKITYWATDQTFDCRCKCSGICHRFAFRLKVLTVPF